ncbi:unnamed protein product [Calicophoron daubneyi]|uniref:Golgi resident protein GCP60 n=1 Tax=Calicophoron daubneyi TaxID=300641 RepID=A0AAV2TBX8_CALDB
MIWLRGYIYEDVVEHRLRSRIVLAIPPLSATVCPPSAGPNHSNACPPSRSKDNDLVAVVSKVSAQLLLPRWRRSLMVDKKVTDPADICETFEREYGFNIEKIYELGHKFLSEKAEKAFHLSFDDRIFLSSLIFQIKYGKFDSSKVDGPGLFDFVGRRRIAQWQSLGDMKPETAMREFVTRLNKICPLFLRYLEAYSRDAQLSSHTNGSLGEDHDSANSTSESPATISAQNSFILQNESEIRQALKSQTREQFEAYAMQQYPLDAEKRKELIADLQERHFHEYVAYIKQHLAYAHQHTQPCSGHAVAVTGATQPESHPSPSPPPTPEVTEKTELANGSVSCAQPTVDPQRASCPQASPVKADTDVDPAHSTVEQTAKSAMPADPSVASPSDPGTKPTGDSTSPNHSPSISADPTPEHISHADANASPESETATSLVRTPTMWTRGELKEFKDNLADAKDAIVQIGCGEVITIRVPAYPTGSSIVWEFATDDYDIGFGLYFEWAPADASASSVGGPAASSEQPNTTSLNKVPSETLETDTVSAGSKTSSQPLVDEIIPVYRRNCHQEIYCGSHIYPGLGTYLFKFDNSYSLWRSKTLYYRVYYTC